MEHREEEDIVVNRENMTPTPTNPRLSVVKSLNPRLSVSKSSSIEQEEPDLPPLKKAKRSSTLAAYFQPLSPSSSPMIDVAVSPAIAPNEVEVSPAIAPNEVKAVEVSPAIAPNEVKAVEVSPAIAPNEVKAVEVSPAIAPNKVKEPPAIAPRDSQEIVEPAAAKFPAAIAHVPASSLGSPVSLGKSESTAIGFVGIRGASRDEEEGEEEEYPATSYNSGHHHHPSTPSLRSPAPAITGETQNIAVERLRTSLQPPSLRPPQMISIARRIFERKKWTGASSRCRRQRRYCAATGRTTASTIASTLFSRSRRYDGGLALSRGDGLALKLYRRRISSLLDIVGGPARLSRRPLSPTTTATQQDDEEEEEEELDAESPMFALQFSKSGMYVAAANEDGYVHLTASTAASSADEETRRGIPEMSVSSVAFRAHRNAIFDIAWADGDATLFTGSGDQSCAMFDVETRTRVANFMGHNGSIKSLDLNPINQGLLATGARDGHVFLWDARVPALSSSSSIAPQVELRNVHTHYALLNKAGGSGSRLRTPPRYLSSLLSTKDSQHSVTAVQFMKDGRTLLSGGSVDGAVKIWDLRKLFYRRKPTPVREILNTSDGGRRAGITCMQLDRSNTRLLVSYHRHKIKLYDLLTPGGQPLVLKSLAGHRSDSFYLKAVFSPDEKFVASGSCDGDVCVWELDNEADGAEPMIRLTGHEQEVNAVDWFGRDDGSGFERIASSSDDGTVRLWTPGDESGEVEGAEGGTSRTNLFDGTFFERHRRDRQDAAETPAVVAGGGHTNVVVPYAY
eukprot:g2485.t1